MSTNRSIGICIRLNKSEGQCLRKSRVYPYLWPKCLYMTVSYMQHHCYVALPVPVPMSRIFSGLGPIGARCNRPSVINIVKWCFISSRSISYLSTNINYESSQSTCIGLGHVLRRWVTGILRVVQSSHFSEPTRKLTTRFEPMISSTILKDIFSSLGRQRSIIFTAIVVCWVHCDVVLKIE